MSKKEQAQEYFREGYNCAQSVFLVFAEEYGMDRDTALKVSASFGGGMGRMREVCGTVSAMALVAGMATGATEGKDAEGKRKNYELTQQLAEEFRKQNGSIICRELLGLDDKSKHQKTEGTLQAASAFEPNPSPRTQEYYKKRPCVELVGDACEILERIIKG